MFLACAKSTWATRLLDAAAAVPTTGAASVVAVSRVRLEVERIAALPPASAVLEAIAASRASALARAIFSAAGTRMARSQCKTRQSKRKGERGNQYICEILKYIIELIWQLLINRRVYSSQIRETHQLWSSLVLKMEASVSTKSIKKYFPCHTTIFDQYTSCKASFLVP